ncbi:MAG: nitroreductase family protein [Methylomonas sp.]|jgi:nitroreductase
MITKPAITSVEINTILQNRWSPRAFDPHVTLADETVTSLLEAARWAPSCFNEQPWRFVVCIKAKDPAGWHDLWSCLVEKNQEWAQHAPVLILTVAMERFEQTGKPNRWAEFDTGAASLSIALQATALGLATHQMGGFDAERSRQLFNLPAETTPMSVMAVGYQAEAKNLSGELKERELAVRTRAALEERFYFGRWGEQLSA